MLYKDKTIIITGGGRGIGKSIAKAYAQEGANVVIAEKTVELGKNTEQEILLEGGKALFIQTDVSNPGDIVNMISQSREMFGRIDVLINNAGFGIWKSIYDISLNEWEDVINTNLRGTFLCSRAAAQVMRITGGGSIINIASTRATMSEPNSELYAASKGGVVSLTHALAASLASDHIQVNCISPGWIETGDYSKLREIDHLQHFSNRVGKPGDIARACLFLTNLENNFINGQNIVVDGGMTKKMIYEPD